MTRTTIDTHTKPNSAEVTRDQERPTPTPRHNHTADSPRPAPRNHRTADSPRPASRNHRTADRARPRLAQPPHRGGLGGRPPGKHARSPKSANCADKGLPETSG